MEGEAKVSTALGDVRIGRVAGDAVLRSASGDVTVAEAETSVTVQTASGDCSASRLPRPGRVTMQRASGDQQSASAGLARPHRRTIDERRHARPSSTSATCRRAADGPQVELRATAMSGDISIVRASRQVPMSRAEILRHRPLRALLVAEVISTTGAQMTWLALPWFVLSRPAPRRG